MFQLIITLAILGLVFYVINLIPMTEPFPKLIKVVAIVIAVVLVLSFLGVHTGLAIR